MDDHPSLEEFAEFLEGHGSPRALSRNTRIIRHLLAGCPVCRSHLKVAQRRAPADPSSYDYTGAFAVAAAVSRQLLSPQTRQPSPSLTGQTSPLPTSRFAKATPHRVEELLAASHAQRYVDLDEMLRFAETAQREADSCLVADAGSEAALEDLRAWSWGQYGNSLRVRGQLEESELALETAERHRASGTGDPRLRARLLEQRAVLAIFQRHLDHAVELNEKAVSFYRKLGEPRLLASACIRSAIAYLYAGRPAEAIQILERTLPLINCKENEDLLLAAYHNLAYCFIDLGRPEEALACHLRLRGLYRSCQDPLILLRGNWLEGLILREVGHFHNAEAALRCARAGFLERELTYEVAIISLDLAELYWKVGELERIEDIVKETEMTFRALGVDIRTLRPLHQFWDAVIEDRRPDL